MRDGVRCLVVRWDYVNWNFYVGSIVAVELFYWNGAVFGLKSSSNVCRMSYLGGIASDDYFLLYRSNIALRSLFRSSGTTSSTTLLTYTTSFLSSLFPFSYILLLSSSLSSSLISFKISSFSSLEYCRMSPQSPIRLDVYFESLRVRSSLNSYSGLLLRIYLGCLFIYDEKRVWEIEKDSRRFNGVDIESERMVVPG